MRGDLFNNFISLFAKQLFGKTFRQCRMRGDLFSFFDLKMSDAESDQSNACSTGDVGVLLEAWLFVKGLWLHCSIPFASEFQLGETISPQQESFMFWNFLQDSTSKFICVDASGNFGFWSPVVVFG